MPKVRRGRVNKHLRAKRRMRKHALAKLDADHVTRWVNRHVDPTKPASVKQAFVTVVGAIVEIRDMLMKEDDDGGD